MKISNRAQKPFLALFFALFALISTATAADGLEARRIAQNSVNLQKMAPVMRPKVRAVISDLEGHGYKPIIHNAVYRTPAEQMRLYRAGYSRVTWSFHNATTRTGQPDSLAADIIDQRWGWTKWAPRRYWLIQARSARAHNLQSGAFFGLKPPEKQALERALNARNFVYSGALGFDPAHVEPRGISLAQAKRGVRPYK